MSAGSPGHQYTLLNMQYLDDQTQDLKFLLLVFCAVLA